VTPRGSTATRAISLGRKKCWNLDSVPWTEHFSSKIALKVRISYVCLAPALPLLLRVCHTATRHRDTIPRRSVSFLVNSVQQLIKLRRLQERVRSRDTHTYVRSELDKESDSGTSVATDPARDDPCNGTW